MTLKKERKTCSSVEKIEETNITSSASYPSIMALKFKKN